MSRTRLAPPVGLEVDLCGVRLATPVLAASGCSGFGRELARFMDLRGLGAIVTKSTSPKPRLGRPVPRLAETPSGVLNGIGLQNPGVDALCRTELPFLEQSGATVVASIIGATVGEFAAMAERLRFDRRVHLLEVNLSCPNVDRRGEVFGADPATAAAVIRAVCDHAGQPVLAKLTADVTSIVDVARAVVDAGAQGLTLINTLLGMSVDVRTRRPRLSGVTGGLSGPAIRPIAVRCVWQVAQALPDVPIVGAGGIVTAEDALEFFLVGATAVSVGTANFLQPTAGLQLAEGLARYLQVHGLDHVGQVRGLLEVGDGSGA